MGLDNAYGSLGLRTGVCTSTSRPASPYEGQVIFETDTNRVLVWDNAAWVMIADTDAPPALQLIKTTTIGSAQSSIPVSDVFSADFDTYKVTISGGAPSTAMNILVTLGATATGYYYAGNGHFYTNNTSVGFAANASSWFAAYGQTTGLNGVLEIFNPFASDETFYNIRAAQGSTTGAVFEGSGYLNNTTSYTGMTFTTSTGTITGGTIRVYGYRNSI